jgi:hypothetical protein
MKKDKLRRSRVHGSPAAPPETPQNRSLKNTDFEDIMMSDVLRDLPFSRNQPLKSADD